MSYKLLSSLFYQDKAIYDKEYAQRFNNISTIHIPLKIHDNEAFVVLVPEILVALEKIHINNSNIDKAFIFLPGVAQQSFINECLIEEMVTTNGIEGVHSTRKEIQIAIDKNLKKDKIQEKKVKFQGLLKRYMATLSNEETNINNCKDVVELYNELVKPEIEIENYPDGEFFRKELVDVRSMTDKVVHTGITPEKKIIEYMEILLNIINSDEMPIVLKCAVAQYFIGYIHPFYDGNGRLGRYIGSQIISKSLSVLVSIRLSYIIKENINKYYKVFTDCNNDKNKGDITPFVLFIIEMLYKSTEDIYKNLTEKIEKKNYYYEKLNKITFSSERKIQETCYAILEIFIQNALFSSEKLDLLTIQQFAEKSRNTVTNLITHLISQGVPIILSKNGNKNLYHLDLDKF